MCRKDTELYHLETFHEFPQSKSHSTKESKFPESVLTVFAKPKRQALVIRLRPISSAQKGKENKRDVSLSAATKRDVNLKAEIRHLVDLAFFSEAVYSDDAEPSQNQLPTPKAKKCVKNTSPLTSRGIIAQLLDEGQKDPGRTLVSNHRQHPRHARKLQTSECG